MIKIQLVIALVVASFMSFAQGQMKTVVHTVEQGQTIYSIARAYQQKPADIKKSNPSLDDDYTIQPGQVLMIVIPNVAPPTTTSQQLMKSSVEHTVTKGDTLYSLSKYYNVTVDDLKRWNKLTDHSIRTGQNIIVGYSYSNKFSEQDDVVVNPEVTTPQVIAPSPVPAIPVDDAVVYSVDENGQLIKDTATAQTPTPTPVKQEQPKTVETPEPIKAKAPIIATPRKLSQQEKLRNKYNKQKSGASVKTVEGAAIWIVSQNRMMNATYYGMFSDVPVGTVVRVQNLNNNKNVYVKVIGSLPDTKENTGALIKLTPAAKKALKTSDAKVRVKVTYAK